MMIWDAIGAVGEIVGAAGVIISLIYLAVQIKNQNIQSQLTAENEMTSQWNDFWVTWRQIVNSLGSMRKA